MAGSLSLSHGPCVIELLDESSKMFIVGTYELDEEKQSEKDNADNNRKGSLLLVVNCECICQYECQNGGVFDFKVNGLNEVVVAHSNGTVAWYKIVGGVDIRLEHYFDTGSEMLTSIDCCFDILSTIAVGDSSGTVTVLQSSKDLSSVVLSSRTKLSNDSIWRVKLVELDSANFLMLTGSDDCLFRVNKISGGLLQEKPVLVNDDASGGVTSFEVIKTNDVDNESVYEILCGSYDEHLRTYSLRTFLSDDSKENAINSLKIEMTLTDANRIAEAGIWKVRKVNSLIFVAGMYAGAYVLEGSEESSRRCQQKLDISRNVNERSNGDSQQQLIYDVAHDKDCSELLVASFYEKTVYWFQSGK
ncbi:hypothetical protein HDE_05739 [Halotydeus destructor]|nr:hypothetical protein HDE_05739 [Halotydeus destructor]